MVQVLPVQDQVFECAADMTATQLIVTALSKSYQNIAADICRVNNWDCRIVPRNSVFLGKVWLYVGSQYDVAYDHPRLMTFAPRAIYITVEGEFRQEYSWAKLRHLCRRSPCYVTSKWGRAIFESHSVPVQDVVYHGVPIAPRIQREALKGRCRPYNAVYLNAHYVFLDEKGSPIPFCERKGWRWWPTVAERVGGVGFIPFGSPQIPHTIQYSAPDIDTVYQLLTLGKVYTSLTTHEGFGLNNLMALAVGTKMVAWDIPIFRELYDGIQGVYFVPTREQHRCYVDWRYFVEAGWFDFMWGDLEEYISTVQKALNDTAGVDAGTVLQKFDPWKLYEKFW